MTSPDQYQSVVSPSCCETSRACLDIQVEIDSMHIHGKHSKSQQSLSDK